MAYAGESTQYGSQRKSPGETIADAAVAGYDEGSAKKAAKKNKSGDTLDSVLGSFKKGGKVKKTGSYLLHRGETVVPARKTNSRDRKHSRKRISTKE